MRVFPVYNLSAYIPDSLVPQFEALRDQLISVLEIFGLAKAPVDTGAGGYYCVALPCKH